MAPGAWLRISLTNVRDQTSRRRRPRTLRFSSSNRQAARWVRIHWHPHNPAWYTGITRINELPPSPKFFSGRWPDLIGIIVGIAAETVFVAIVTFTGVKDLVLHVLPDIGFERSVLLRP